MLLLPLLLYTLVLLKSAMQSNIFSKLIIRYISALRGYTVDEYLLKESHLNQSRENKTEHFFIHTHKHTQRHTIVSTCICVCTNKGFTNTYVTALTFPDDSSRATAPFRAAARSIKGKEGRRLQQSAAVCFECVFVHLMTCRSIAPLW